MREITENLKNLIEENFSQDNYLIDCDKNCKQAVIYFSSNGLYGDNDINLFKKNIIEKNKFEFYKTRIKNSKHIFLRDIRNNWYRDGINLKINSQEKLTEFLKEQTKGLEVITIGSSAGGYAALLFGNLLNAKKIFAFSPQVEIPNEKIKLLDLMRKSTIPSYIMYPVNFELDVKSYNVVKDLNNVRGLAILSSVHGVPVYKNILKLIINSKDKKLDKMYSGELYKERFFVIKYFGIIPFINRLIGKNITKKYFNKIFGITFRKNKF